MQARWKRLYAKLEKSGLTDDEKAKVWEKLLSVPFDRAAARFLARNVESQLRKFLAGKLNAESTLVLLVFCAGFTCIQRCRSV